MTTVCAVARDGVVVMGADTMTNVYDRPVDGVVKVRRLPLGDGTGDVLLGFCGSGALPDVVTRHLTIAAAPADGEPCQRWASTVAQAITEIALEHRLTNSDGVMDGSLLLGYGGHVWTVSHQQATPHRDGIAAIGSGEGPAIGAIDYGLTHGEDDLVALVVCAVRIGIERDRHSGGAVTVERLG